MSENNESKKVYVASFKNSGQISPDDWATWLETKICTRDTTLGEIEDWFRNKRHFPEALLSCEISAGT